MTSLGAVRIEEESPHSPDASVRDQSRGECLGSRVANEGVVGLRGIAVRFDGVERSHSAIGVQPEDRVAERLQSTNEGLDARLTKGPSGVAF